MPSFRITEASHGSRLAPLRGLAGMTGGGSGGSFRTILPFYGALLAALFLVTYVSSFSFALPRYFLGN
jgi:hypothetical protein